MIKEVDEDNDGLVSLREFFLIFRKAAKKELKSAVQHVIARPLCFKLFIFLKGLLHLVSQIDVSEEGVGGAKGFFEAKIEQQSLSKKNEEVLCQAILAENID